jgi:transcriptional regulator with XRE-family HTH domain
MARKITRLANIDQEIGRRIKKRRMFLGMTMPELAEKIDVTHQQVQKYENGINRISAGRLYAIAEALEVTMDYFFNDVEDLGVNLNDNIDEGKRMCIEIAKNFMNINNKDYKTAINALVRIIANKN